MGVTRLSLAVGILPIAQNLHHQIIPLLSGFQHLIRGRLWGSRQGWWDLLWSGGSYRAVHCHSCGCCLPSPSSGAPEALRVGPDCGGGPKGGLHPVTGERAIHLWCSGVCAGILQCDQYSLAWYCVYPRLGQVRLRWAQVSGYLHQATQSPKEIHSPFPFLLFLFWSQPSQSPPAYRDLYFVGRGAEEAACQSEAVLACSGPCTSAPNQAVKDGCCLYAGPPLQDGSTF